MTGGGIVGPRTRLYLAGTAIFLTLLIPALYGLSRIRDLRAIAFDLGSRHVAAFLAVGELRSALADLNRAQEDYLASPALSRRRVMYDQLDKVALHVAHLASSGYAQDAADEALLVDSLRLITREIDSFAARGSVERAEVQFERLQPLFSSAQATLARVAVRIDQQNAAQIVRAQAITDKLEETILIAFGVALVVALLLGGLTVASRILPLFRLRSAMSAVAAGHFRSPADLPYGREDGIGDLCRSFRSMTEQLAELDRLKAEFVSMASHELKSPLGAIAGYAEMLQDQIYGPLTTEQRKRLAYIRDQAGTLRERVDHLLSVSRMQARGLVLEVTEVTVREVLEEVREAYTPMARQKGVEFTVRIHASAPEVVEMDRERVSQELLGNVTSNAFKFTPIGGRVDIRALGRDGYLVLEVRDTGEGIPESQLPYVFEKYYQAGDRTHKVGSGLGLAIAREVAEGHGGRIEVRSHGKEGATFHIYLPLRCGRQGKGSSVESLEDDAKIVEETSSPSTVGRSAPV